ncbi:5-formyltetrahydrofolate cyclo-ligase [Halalkalibacter urbisdiaboli]|uniref:5-formyltetrahydrofolate cyclo-ligase n=1 Tax=Halalkalibacter urbisdiaboli TaxID=1960589 RepID=UPI000B433AE8|nr:5-formyltetrahydrofolate cyclo-ligase [Halalkalibacter urbisdiaboli]
MDEKKSLRMKTIARLNALSNDVYLTQSANIAEQLFKQDYWKEAHVIGITLSRKKEVSTEAIIKNAWNSNKRVAVPRVNVETHEMDFYFITSYDEVEETFFQLREPKVEECPFVSPDQIDTLIVPGLAFDLKGSRLGFGGGYYDRYLPSFKGTTVALAFDCQIVPSIPTEKHDIPIEHLITPQGALR